MVIIYIKKQKCWSKMLGIVLGATVSRGRYDYRARDRRSKTEWYRRSRPKYNERRV